MIERRERQPRDWDQYAGMEPDFVFGIAPVLAALRYRSREAYYTLYVETGFKERFNMVTAPGKKSKQKEHSRAARIFAEAEKLFPEAQSDESLKVVEVPKGQLAEAPGLRDSAHQGVALCCSPLMPVILDRLPASAPPGSVWLALDEIQDPRNLGALLRSARFLGAQGVVVSIKNSAPLSPAASKASAGAVEEMSTSVYGARNLPRLLNEAKATWRVVAATTATMRNKTKPVSLASFGPVGPQAPPTIIVLGSEGTGLRKLVLDAAEFRVMVPSPLLMEETQADHHIDDDDDDEESEEETLDDLLLNDDDQQETIGKHGALESEVDSLNVAVTGALMLYHFLPDPSLQENSDSSS